MKGSISFPLCGLSSSACFMLKKCNYRFSYFDVLGDPELHAFLRKRHAPSCVPYLYIDGNFVGGYNEICNMFNSGDLLFIGSR
ncbi:MAG: hypothetical protein LBT70_00450 [Holosporaceae bacterium]|nr:hypothetical protein [Holosporaceae bacterium]